MSRINYIKSISICMGLSLLAACSNNPTEPKAAAAGSGGKEMKAGTYGTARFSLNVGKVGALSKSSAITMKKLILTAIATGDKPDTVRDTSTIGGNDQQTVNRALKLKPKSTWVLYAKTLDQKDSVVHQGTTQPFSIKLQDTTNVTLILQSRFTMYQATFANLPYSAAVGNEKIGIAINRLVLKVDGVAKADSSVKDAFSPIQTVVLGFDYVSVGSHNITLEAHGITGKYTGILYAGTANVTTVPGEDGKKSVVLNWAGPNTGVGQASIIVGHVGKMEINPVFSDNEAGKDSPLDHDKGKGND
jgi:hypothetical protein